MITISKNISTHFHSSEFRCKCGCKQIKIDEELVIKLEHIFDKLNASKCIISSGYRCPAFDMRIGGFTGYHAKGYAADCIYYDKDGKVIPSKIVICVAYDLGELKGIAKIDDNYVHLDNRASGYYKGDETVSNNSCWTNPYDYFKVSASDVARYTGVININSIKYQSHGLNKKWYPNVSKGSDDYAGVFGVTMDGLYIDNLDYCVKVDGRWLPIVKGRSDYAGILGKGITDVAIKGDVEYRVHVKGGKWLPYVKGKNFNLNDSINGYAGNGKIIDAIQIK